MGEIMDKELLREFNTQLMSLSLRIGSIETLFCETDYSSRQHVISRLVKLASAARTKGDERLAEVLEARAIDLDADYGTEEEPSARNR